jgi:hypothetical protein
MRKTVATVAVVAAALVLPAANAVALPGGKTSSKVEITKAKGDADGVDIKGTVSSRKASCEKGRRVSVYHDVAPPGPSDMDFLLGETTTNENGKWRLGSTFLPDKVYAVVAGKKKCKQDKSKTETVVYAP